MVSIDIGVWITAAFVLMSLSFIFKDTPLYRLVEAVLVGGTNGYALWVAIENLQRLGLKPVLQLGAYDKLIPLIIGIFYFFHLLGPKYSWVSRYPVAITVGTAVGAIVVPAVNVYFVKPLILTLVPFWTSNLMTNVNNLIIYSLTFCGVAFFIFSRETFTRGRYKIVSTLGRAGLMVAFGSAVGTLLGAKIAPLVGQLKFLLFTWLGL